MSSLLAILLGLLSLGLAGSKSGGGDAAEPEGDPAAGTVGDGTGGEGSGGGGAASDLPVLPESAYDIGWAGLSAEEQLLVELVNRARLDPLAEAERLGIALADGAPTGPVEVLAVDATLSLSARLHSQDMDDRDFLDHVNPDGQDPTDRAIEAGWSGGGVAENIGVRYSSSTSLGDLQSWIEAHHADLWGSEGHQAVMLLGSVDVVGLGYDLGDDPDWTTATYVTEDFAASDALYLTGVVIDDVDADGFYDLGEGQGGVHVTAWNDTGAFATATWDAGGYTLELAAGTYTVHFEGGDLAGSFETTVVIGSENVKLDVFGESATTTAAMTQPEADTEVVVAAEVMAYVPEDDAIAALFAAVPPVSEDDFPEEDTPEPSLFDFL